MPYTLTKGLGWFLLALLLGMLIGWLLRSIAATRQMRRLRAVKTDHSELDRLRARNANLEPLVAERDRLAADLATATLPTAGPAAPDSAAIAVAEAEIEAIAADEDASEDEIEFTELNLVAASSVIGKKVKLDDLTVIEGIGPDIVGLCNGIGIHTWAELAATEVSLLRTMLSDAGSGFETHDPTSWPRQAGFLVVAQWEEFKALTDSLAGDHAAE